jgi:preprotein translocase subunit SecY
LLTSSPFGCQFSGAIGSGTGILLAVTTIYSVYETVAKVIDLHLNFSLRMKF